MLGFGSDSGNPVNNLYFAEPGSKSQELFNELVDIVKNLEKDEEKWEKVLESEAEKGRMDASRIQQLDVKIENKHEEFEGLIQRFASKLESEREKASVNRDQKEITEIETVVGNIESRAENLDAYIESTNKAIRNGNSNLVAKQVEKIEEDREETLREMENLKEELAR
jgi:chromosome segregation ATPase